MTINYVLTAIDGEQIWAPIVCCDHCRRQITEHGNVLWDPNTSPAHPLFAHKGLCDHAIEQRHPHLIYWEELDRWLQQLTNNSVKPGHRVQAIEGIEHP